jgi:phosphomannomutase
VITALQTLEVISRSGGSFSDALKPFRRYWNSGEINSEVADKEGAMRRVEEAYAGGRVDHTDGLLVDYEDWWFSLRPSNTEPLLRLNVEARNAAAGETERDKILSMIRA